MNQDSHILEAAIVLSVVILLAICVFMLTRNSGDGPLFVPIFVHTY